MEKPKNLNDTVEPDEISRRRKQFAISLKFHHDETLRKIPLEIAVQVISEVWASCHPEDFPEYRSGDSTAIIPKEQLAKSIRESKYFSG